MSIIFYVLSTPALQPQFTGSFTFTTAVIFALAAFVSVILFQIIMEHLFGATRANIFIVSLGIGFIFVIVSTIAGAAGIIVLNISSIVTAFVTSFVTALLSLALLGATTKEKMIPK